jgi:hypothetical protein
LAARPLFQRPSALPMALGLYLLTMLGVGGMGVVGEVAASWTWGPPPLVAVDLTDGEPTWSDPGIEPHAGHRLGPLRASQTRPLERVQLGPVWLPLAVNSYTGGPADWPARLVHGVTRSTGAVLGLNLLLGAGLILLMARLLRDLGLRDAPGVALLVLATDWCFLFYRRVLGGTELLLLLAGLLLIQALWQRRFDGRRGDTLLGLALGLGLLAKITFLPTALAFGLATVLTRGDGAARPAAPRLRPLRVIGIAAAVMVPLWLALLHQLALPDEPRVFSHDGLAMQISRLGYGLKGLWSGGGGAARELPASLAWFFLEPLRWFAPALGARSVSWGWAAVRLLGWVVVLWGVGLAWAARPAAQDTQDRGEALLRWLSIAAPLQVALLWLANHDLHHLAQAVPTLALLVGLGCERVARGFTAPRSAGQAALAVVLCLPFVLAGFASGVRTRDVISTVPAPAITEHGQRALDELLEEHGVRRLWTSDYDLYGVFELRRPGMRVSHAWGAISTSRDRPALLADLLRAARGGHYLAVRPAAVRIYDLAPSEVEVQRAAAVAGVEAVLVGQIEGEGWARLYEVSDR